MSQNPGLGATAEYIDKAWPANPSSPLRRSLHTLRAYPLTYEKRVLSYPNILPGSIARSNIEKNLSLFSDLVSPG